MLITRDGLFTLLEPSESEALSVWKELDTIYPFGQHSRGTEPKFTTSFHQAEQPCYNAVMAGLDPKALSLAVSAMNLIKIFRAIKPEDGQYRLHEVAKLVTDAPLINDISWAPGCIRPYDLIAAACDDGSIRIFEVNTPHGGDMSIVSILKSPIPSGAFIREPAKNPRNAPSGIGAGLADVNRAAAAARHTAVIANIKHEWKEIAVLPHDDSSAVCKVRWLHDG